MEGSEPNINKAPSPLVSEPDQSPITKIRTETVLSRLPIHNLAKRGRVNIQIMKKNPDGEVTLQWEVSHSDRYGQPRQIAYKLDTIVINRRIDEAGRPLPGMICLGSLRDIAAELGLGGDTNQIRRALRQNAFAAITAKMTYRATDRTEKRLEADFTRYGVVFTGEKLPDGRRADAVYIILNEPYREVLNNAPLRPLNYAYLKVLPPAAQRFYEVLSYRVFATLTAHKKEARISYSDYCAFSAQQRYLDYTHFKKQMYKIHRLHLQSGYLKSIKYSATTDVEGRADWMMCYEPGPRAEAEFGAFAARGPVAGSKHPLELSGGEWTVDEERPRHDTPRRARAASSSEAAELVQLFHRLARGVDAYDPPPGSRECVQAEELLNARGSDAARFVVLYAVEQAKRTNFSMRRFGALTQYVPEALTVFRKRCRSADAKKQQEQSEADDKSRAEELHRLGREKLASLPAGLRRDLYDKVKAETLTRSTWIKQMDTSFLERIIEAAMIARLTGAQPTKPAQDAVESV